jgi:dolichol-phosphate mannosyltransferase
MKVLLLLCTYNECENIQTLCSRIAAQNLGAHILIIDDGSPDGTGEIADCLAKEDHHIQVIHRPAKSGLGRAIAAGFDYAISNDFDVCINMDADLSHDPQELPQMVQAIGDTDVVVGSRHVRGGKIIGWPVARQWNHRIANHLARFLLGIRTRDVTNSYKAYRTSALKTIPYQEIMDCGFVGHTLLMSAFERKGYRVKEVPSCFVDRNAGHSKMSWGERWDGLCRMIHFRRKWA